MKWSGEVGRVIFFTQFDAELLVFLWSGRTTWCRCCWQDVKSISGKKLIGKELMNEFLFQILFTVFVKKLKSILRTRMLFVLQFLWLAFTQILQTASFLHGLSYSLTLAYSTIPAFPRPVPTDDDNSNNLTTGHEPSDHTNPPRTIRNQLPIRLHCRLQCQ